MMMRRDTPRDAFPCVAASMLLPLLLLCLCAVDASNFHKPHGHQGKVEPFLPGDPKVVLDSKALKVLKSGKPYQTQMQSGSSGRGLVVQDVDAPTSTVWGRILDYDNYASMVPKTVESKNYRVEKHAPTKANNFLEQTIYTRMKVGFPMLKLEFFVKHLYYPRHASLTWTLDYSKQSDFDDSCGYWYIVPHPDDPDRRTRVYYSVQVSMFDWVPKFVVDFMSSKALTDATGWVKKYSEIEAKKQREKEGEAGEEGSAGAEGGRKRMRDENPIVRFFNIKRRRREARERQATSASESEEVTCTDGGEGGAAVNSDEDESARGVMLIVKARWPRFALLALFVVLALYNPLFLDQSSWQKSE